jgi:hypothetical protein
MSMCRRAMALCMCAGAASSVMASDDCSTATVLTTGVSVSGNTANSNPSTGIPASHCAGTSETGKDDWYTYTASTADTYTFSMCVGTTFDSALSLWTGCPDGTLTPVACSDDACGAQSRLTRAMAAGETLLVRVGGYNASSGAYGLVVNGTLPPPANDNCAGATPVSLGANSGTNASATLDGSASCGGTGPDVWYTFTAATAGDYQIDTCNTTGFDTVVSLYDACGGTQLACNDDSTCAASGLRSTVQKTFAAGETVTIRVAGFSEFTTTGPFVLNVSAITPPPPPPANDDCSGILPIGDGADQPYDTTSATDSGIAIANCVLPVTINNDIFYSYTASCTGDVTIDTCGTSYDTVIAVFDACGGAQVACSDDSDACGEFALQSSLTFSATSGTSYVVVIGSYLTIAEGPGNVSISCVPVVPPCPADFNGDGFLDFFDYDDYVACFEGAGAPGCDADFNGDGFVDFFDYDDFVAAFEVGC